MGWAGASEGLPYDGGQAPQGQLDVQSSQAGEEEPPARLQPLWESMEPWATLRRSQDGAARQHPRQLPKAVGWRILRPIPACVAPAYLRGPLPLQKVG